MTEFAIIDAKPWHAGQMIRLLRAEHWAAVTQIGVNGHRELRDRFDESGYRRAWLIDGKLAGLGGVTGPAICSVGMIWLALSQDAMRHPLEVVREARRQIDAILRIKTNLVAQVLEDDEAAKRFAIFMGFVPVADDRPGAYSRQGRRAILHDLDQTEHQTPVGRGAVLALRYAAEAA